MCERFPIASSHVLLQYLLASWIDSNSYCKLFYISSVGMVSMVDRMLHAEDLFARLSCKFINNCILKMIVPSCKIFSCKLVNTESCKCSARGFFFLQIYRQKMLHKKFFLQDSSCKYRRTKILHQTLLSCKIFFL